MKQTKLFIVILTICSVAIWSSCSSIRYPAGQSISALAYQIREFSQGHPDGFTLDISTMTDPHQVYPWGMQKHRTAIRASNLRR